MRKRIVVGFFVLAQFIFPMYVSPFVLVLTQINFLYNLHYEVYHVLMKEFENCLSFRLMRYSVSLFVVYLFVP